MAKVRFFEFDSSLGDFDPALKHTEIEGQISRIVSEYLSQVRDESSEDFNLDTPFMDAGLDSLDMLKVSF